MKTIVTKTNAYLYSELDEYGKRKAIENFKLSGYYQYAYAWMDNKCIETMMKEKWHFTSTGNIVPT
jgi:hypothetical protein